MGDFSKVLRTNQDQPTGELRECAECRAEATYKSRCDGGTPQLHYPAILSNCQHAKKPAVTESKD